MTIKITRLSIIFWALTTIGFDVAIGQEASIENQLLLALKARDLEKFETLLESGADPLLPTEGNRFRSTSMCESTKKGNEPFFQSILRRGVNLNFVSPLGGYESSPVNCAIFNRNHAAILAMLEYGLDINRFQNPAVKNKIFLRTPLHNALHGNDFQIAWEIVQHIEVSESQEKLILRKITQRGGIEGHPQYPFRKKFTEWLRHRGHEFDVPAPSKRVQ